MSIVSDVFEIFQGKGLVQKIRDNARLDEFIVLGFVLIGAFSTLYGLVTGISVSIQVALHNMVKVPVIAFSTLLMSFPAYFISLKIAGIKENGRQILAIVLSLFFVSGLTLAIASPILFFYYLANSHVSQYYFIHVIIIDLALIGGLIIMSMTLNKAIVVEDKSILVLPVIIGTIFVGLALWSTILFWGPFFEDTAYFSRGVQRICELYLDSGLSRVSLPK